MRPGVLAVRPRARIAETRVELYSIAVKHALFAVVPVLFTAWGLYVSFRTVGMRAVDFHHEFWPAATRLARGASPYGLGWQDFNGGVAFPYPALAAVAFVPLSLLPQGLADALYTTLLIGATFLTLWVLRVRDWRVYGVALLWGPVAAAWQSANLTLVLVLGTALLWRARHRPFVAGLLVALLISLKPFIWPLAVWLLTTRRWAAVGWAAACGAVLNLAAWAVVGFNQVDAYRRVVQGVTAIMEHRGYSIINFASHLGWDGTPADLLTVVTILGLVAGCIAVGYRGDHQRALALSIAAAILGTPVLWTHYFALLLVPVAIARPRLSIVWALPLVFWLCPSTAPGIWQIALALVIDAMVIGLVTFRPNPSVRSSKLVKRSILVPVKVRV